MANSISDTLEPAQTLVEVFKTDIQKVSEAAYLLQRLLDCFPQYAFNVDLDDCDKILRVEGDKVKVENIALFVRSLGFSCCVLEE